MHPTENKDSSRSHTGLQVVLKADTIIGKIEAANAVPPMLAPKPEIAEIDMESNPEQLPNKERLTTNPDLNPSTNLPEKRKLTKEEADLLMNKLDLSGILDIISQILEDIIRIIS